MQQSQRYFRMCESDPPPGKIIPEQYPEWHRHSTAIINTAESLVEKSRVPFISAWYNRSVRASECRGFRLNILSMKPALQGGSQVPGQMPEPRK